MTNLLYFPHVRSKRSRKARYECAKNYTQHQVLKLKPYNENAIQEACQRVGDRIRGGLL